MPAADAIEVGRILEPWGVKGWLRVRAHAADPQTLLAARVWRLEPPEPPASAAPGTLPATLSIREVRRHGDGLVALADGIEDRTGAERLAGARILIERSQFPAPATDEYYWTDLVGCAVVNRDGVRLGTVSGLLDNGVQSVLRIVSAGDAPERLVPFVAAYVDDVDLATRTIRVDWGLDY